MKRLSPTLLLLGAAAAATPEELALASEELQDGTLDAEGLNIFRQHAAQHPGDWRAHGMLGQALAQKGLPGALGALRTASKLAPGVGQLALALAETLSAGSGEGVAEEAVRAFRRALRLTPALGSASVYTRLGIALAGAELSAEPAAVEETDEAVRAWTTSVALDPRGVQTQILLARRLSHGSSGAQRAQATRAAKAAVRLDPRSVRRPRRCVAHGAEREQPQLNQAERARRRSPHRHRPPRGGTRPEHTCGRPPGGRCRRRGGS